MMEYNLATIASTAESEKSIPRIREARLSTPRETIPSGRADPGTYVKS